jgi:hypothetical protein
MLTIENWLFLGLTQLTHGDRYDRPNPITVTRPIGLPVDKQSKTWR